MKRKPSKGRRKCGRCGIVKDVSKFAWHRCCKDDEGVDLSWLGGACDICRKAIRAEIDALHQSDLEAENLARKLEATRDQA